MGATGSHEAAAATVAVVSGGPVYAYASNVDNRTGDAEFSILVSKYIRAMGLGRHLILRLVRWARGQKVERLYGDVFDQNTPMLSLCESLGFTRQQDQDTPGLFRIVLDLREQHPDGDATAEA